MLSALRSKPSLPPAVVGSARLPVIVVSSSCNVMSVSANALSPSAALALNATRCIAFGSAVSGGSEPSVRSSSFSENSLTRKLMRGLGVPA